MLNQLGLIELWLDVRCIGSGFVRRIYAATTSSHRTKLAPITQQPENLLLELATNVGLRYYESISRVLHLS